MSESKEPESSEPDTPIERVTFPEVVQAVETLVARRRYLNSLEAEFKREKERVLELMDRVPDLHGTLLPNGDAVRKSWSVSQSKIEPEKLREVLADAPEYIYETVDVTALHQAYPSVWEKLAKVKRRRTLTVRLKESEPDAV